MRPEIAKFQDTIDYLDGNCVIDPKFRKKARLVTEGKVSAKRFISQKGRVLVEKVKNHGKKVTNWTSEYLEFMLYKIVFALVRPFPPKKSDLARDLGISLRVLHELINTNQYLEIKKSLRREMREKWGAEIDQVVIRRALKGSETAAKLFYDLQGELIQKLEVTKKEDIPQTQEEKAKLIDRLIKEVNQSFRDKVISTKSGKIK